MPSGYEDALITVWEDGHLVADRCGGRMHYAYDLRRLCPNDTVEIVQEAVVRDGNKTSLLAMGGGRHLFHIRQAEQTQRAGFARELL